MENKLENNENTKIILDIKNFELFLINSGYLAPNIWTQNNSDWFDWNKVNEIMLSFEFNEKISATEASVNYGDKIQWMNKIFNTETTFEELHNQYIHYTSTNISFTKFLNCYIMLEIILKTFYNVLNKNNEKNINNIFNEEIVMNDIDLISSLKDKNILGLKQKLQSISSKIKRNPTYNGKDANSKLIIIIFLLSLGSTFSVDKNIPKIENLMNMYTIFNKIYLNDINISLILFFNVILCINLCIYANKKKSHFKNLNFDKKNYETFFYKEFKKKINLEKLTKKVEKNDDKKTYISLSIFDNDIIIYKGNDFCELLLFQNYLKIFSIYHFSKNQIKFTINLTVDTIVETLKTFSDKIIINKNSLVNQNNAGLNGDIINKNPIINSIKLSNLLLLSQNNLNKCFATFNFNELLIKVTNFQIENQVMAMNSKYIELIHKTKKLYFQNLIPSINEINVDINQTNEETKVDIKESLDKLTKEFKVINYFLTYYHKNKEAKKNLRFYCFKFNFVKCSIYRKGKKEIQIFFDYSSIKERILLKYMKYINNVLSLIKQYEEVLNNLYEFKSYNIIFRVCQTIFRTDHINFYFSIIIKILAFFVEENKYNRVTLYDSKLKHIQENMCVYIKDNEVTKKSRINYIKDMFNESFFNNKLKVFNKYVKNLAEDWDIIIIGENIKYNNIISWNNANILFLNLIKEVNENSVQTFMAGSSINNIKKSVMNIGSSINPVGEEKSKKIKNIANYEYLNIFMYVTSDENFAEKIIKFCEDLKKNNNFELENKITFVCERYFFEEKIIISTRIKGGSKQIYNYVDDYLLTCNKKIEEEFYKYDLYITKNTISVVNHNKQKLTDDFYEIINSFISVLSTCIELVLYILKNKETDPTKFFYLQRINKEYYLFEYKVANIFIKKLKYFESVLSLNTKKSIPLFCFLIEKNNNDYIETNDCFLDLFLRLFLNLNKVVDEDALNQNFFGKIHKNMFYQNYESFKLMTFSYEAFCGFNEILINNNYLDISKNDKFEICYIMTYEVDQKQKIEKFNKILEYQKNNKLIVKNLKIYDYNLNNTFIFQNINELKMNFLKAEFFIDYHTSNDIHSLIKNKMLCIYRKLKERKIDKKNIKKILNNVKEFYYQKNSICCFNGTTSDFEKFLIEYNTKLVKIKEVRLDHRAFHF